LIGAIIRILPFVDLLSVSGRWPRVTLAPETAAVNAGVKALLASGVLGF